MVQAVKKKVKRRAIIEMDSIRNICTVEDSRKITYEIQIFSTMVYYYYEILQHGRTLHTRRSLHAASHSAFESV